jgi:hypothetical protein
MCRATYQALIRRKLVARVMLFAKHAQLISRAQKCKTQPNTQIQMDEHLRTLRI